MVAPTQDTSQNTSPPVTQAEAIRKIIHPFPNISIFRFAHVTSLFSGLSKNFTTALQKFVFKAPDFNALDAAAVDLGVMKNRVTEMNKPWNRDSEGWVSHPIFIRVPNSVKRTKANRQQITSNEDQDLPEVEGSRVSDREGAPFRVNEFYRRGLMPVIESIVTKDPSAKFFYWEPFRQMFQRPGSTDPPIQVYGELYMSKEWNDEHEKIQKLDLSDIEEEAYPRAIVALQFWSDSTHLADFGQAKAWPIYLAFGNQSKYERYQRSRHGMHHVGYLPSLTSQVKEFLRSLSEGKMPSTTLLAHLRRELFQGGWDIILDEDFLHAYCYGKVMLCADGIKRRLFPRIFIYSADYPEKCLIGTIRDMGDHCCPRCHVKKSEIWRLGTKADMKVRGSPRTDDDVRRGKIETCRSFIYEKGYAVNSQAVENILKDQSLTPTRNAFSKLSEHGFDFHKILVPDFMHEVELGLHKNVITHLIRILNSKTVPGANVVELNKRYSDVPVFGESTIRHFPPNTSELKKLAAHDFEDIILCSIACFEDLLPSDDNKVVLDLLYTMCQFHSFAKLQMHTAETVSRLRSVITKLGNDLRAFSSSVCANYDTYETESEMQARGRANLRRAALKAKSSNIGSTSSSSTSAQDLLQTSNSRIRKAFNLNTYKLHSIPDYPDMIIRVGPLDLGSTREGEMEHRTTKTRYRQSNKNNATGQMVKADVYEREMRYRAHALRELGLELPVKGKNKMIVPSPSAPTRSVDKSLLHAEIAKDQKNWTHIGTLLLEHEDDAQYENFMLMLRTHILGQLSGANRADEDLTFTDEDTEGLVFEGDRLFYHAQAKFNYTTYDLRMDKDVVKPADKSTKCFVLVASREEILSSAPDSDTPFWYAQVIGIHHVVVSHEARRIHKRRVNFLRVRWLGVDPEWTAGDRAKRLDRVGFVPYDGDTEPFGFVSLAHVIRACHLIPAFAFGKTDKLLPDSVDWINYYVNKFVDRDMYMRYTGLGIGHVGSNGAFSPNGEEGDFEMDDEDLDEAFPDSITDPTDRNESGGMRARRNLQEMDLGDADDENWNNEDGEAIFDDELDEGSEGDDSESNLDDLDDERDMEDEACSSNSE
ncbi:hypothetical protein SCHPADRAFT_820248 [Schizopora paradoxa]|uniref:Uncharacterized protein n=1 Tax=Schizopora paradoxa TaxID=27342 RepID=A0A0H2S8Y5_9AGAM|nr:hypothetical protein SCHPADRAFT_820248 [Schizopora paradoxa]